MVDLSHHFRLPFKARARRSHAWLSEITFQMATAWLDVLTIFLAAIISGVIFHVFRYGDTGLFENYLETAGLMTVFYLLLNLYQKKYQIASCIGARNVGKSVFFNWNNAIMLMLVVLFMTKSTDVLSRGSVFLFYFIGLGLLVAVRFAVVRWTGYACKAGWIESRRILLLGDGDMINDFQRRYQPWNLGFTIVDAMQIPLNGDGENSPVFHFAGQPQDVFSMDIEVAVRQAREMSADDVFVMLPWSEKQKIDEIVSAFRAAPVAIHLGPDALMETYQELSVEKNGAMPSLKLVGNPLTLFDRFLKRSFDIVFSLLGLVVLGLMFPVIAWLVKRESEGPVLFRQERGGFNGKPFSIYKFRTLRQVDETRKEYDENGLEIVRQVTNTDDRMTKIGDFLRRSNIDELPQLLNVLRGEMSLVGPRPHALQHDAEFQKTVAEYARRHNVKPGITGLAQVNGYRGETDTEEKVRGRVRYDLQYIDGWSLWRDIQIIFLTIFSRKARENAK